MAPSPVQQPRPELRLVLTVDDLDAALATFRDVLGMPEAARFEDDEGLVVLLDAGRATLELSDREHAAFIDRLEVGQALPAAVHMAVSVTDARRATADLVAAGLELIAEPTATPWGSLNARLLGPGDVQLTLFQGEPDT